MNGIRCGTAVAAHGGRRFRCFQFSSSTSSFIIQIEREIVCFSGNFLPIIEYDILNLSTFSSWHAVQSCAHTHRWSNRADAFHSHYMMKWKASDANAIALNRFQVDFNYFTSAECLCDSHSEAIFIVLSPLFGCIVAMPAVEGEKHVNDKLRTNRRKFHHQIRRKPAQPHQMEAPK